MLLNSAQSLTRCKESISKAQGGLERKMDSSNTSIAEIGSEVRRVLNAGIGTVSRFMERLDTRDNSRVNGTTLMPGSVRGSNNHHNSVTANGSPLRDGDVSASCAPGSRQT